MGLWMVFIPHLFSSFDSVAHLHVFLFQEQEELSSTSYPEYYIDQMKSLHSVSVYFIAIKFQTVMEVF